jgi:hypothetical protein
MDLLPPEHAVRSVSVAKSRLLELGEAWDADRKSQGAWGSPLVKLTAGAFVAGFVGALLAGRRRQFPFRWGTLLLLARWGLPTLASLFARGQLGMHQLGLRKATTRYGEA